MADQCDVAILGSGPGGNDDALRAHQLRARVALVEKERVGGPCLNIGCIPTGPECWNPRPAFAMPRSVLTPTGEVIVPEFLETTVDKFIFRVAADRHYSSQGLWAQAEGNRVRIGLTDFLQQRSGDVAFAEVKPAGTALAAGDEVAAIETIKVNISLTSPLRGRVVEVNPAMETAPEAINQDPYGEGWLAVLEAADWEADRARLLDPQAYVTLMKGQAEEEARKP